MYSFMYLLDDLLCAGQKRILKARREMLNNREADWAMGEAFAFGSLLMEGKEREREREREGGRGDTFTCACI